MFYQAYRPAKYFFSRTQTPIDARQFKDSMDFQWNRLLKPNRYAMMNVSSTHDAPRLLSCFANPTKYKFHANPYEDSSYFSGKPSDETYQLVRLYLVQLFTSIGAPQIWNGEEMGMWGSDDPDPRKPLWWRDINFQNETSTNIKPGRKQYDTVGFNQQHFDWYKKLIALRKTNPVLIHGDFEFFLTEGKRLGYKRFDGKDEILVLFNLEGNDCTMTLPEEGQYTNLLDGTQVEGKEVKVKELGAMVLKKK